MLTLARRPNESIVLHTSDGKILITVASIQGNQAKISFDAPRGVNIWRKELVVPKIGSCQQGIANRAKNTYA
jgi:carbon storage regulator CsrA